MAFKLLKYTWLFMEPPCKNEMPSSHYHGSVENDAIAKGTSLGGKPLSTIVVIGGRLPGPNNESIASTQPLQKKRCSRLSSNAKKPRLLKRHVIGVGWLVGWLVAGMIVHQARGSCRLFTNFLGFATLRCGCKKVKDILPKRWWTWWFYQGAK